MTPTKTEAADRSGPEIPGSDPPVGDPNRTVDLPVTAYDPGGLPRAAVSPDQQQVRVASAPDINLDTLSCSQLQALSFADCFTRLSQIRIWKDGNPDTEPLVKDVNVLGGCGTPGDGVLRGAAPRGGPTASTTSPSRSTWGDRDDGTKRVPVTNFTVKANGITLPFAGRSGETATYASSGGAIPGNPGANDVSVSLAWYDDGEIQHASGGGKPVRRSAGIRQEPVHLE